MTQTSLTQTVVLVQTPTPAPGDEGGQGEDFGKSSPVGFVVLLLFFVAVIFLVRSMNKHLRRVPDHFDEPAAADGKPGEDSNTGEDSKPGEDSNTGRQ